MVNAMATRTDAPAHFPRSDRLMHDGFTKACGYSGRMEANRGVCRDFGKLFHF